MECLPVYTTVGVLDLRLRLDCDFCPGQSLLCISVVLYLRQDLVQIECYTITQVFHK